MDVQKFELCEGPVESIEFPPGSVPVHIAAKVYGRDSCWVRAGILCKWLPIGIATRDNKPVPPYVEEMDSRKGRIAYYISPRTPGMFGKESGSMSTVIRPELSKSSKYWIDRHRYYELKHFCLQYPIWKKAAQLLDALSKSPSLLEEYIKSGRISDPTVDCAEARSFYLDRIDLLERTAENAAPEIAKYLVTGVTSGVSYDFLKSRLDIPCCKETYYDLYRRFFWLLDRERK